MNSRTSTPAPPFCAEASTTAAGLALVLPQAFPNYQHSKLLLMAPGYDRSGGVGFRCVRDAQ